MCRAVRCHPLSPWRPWPGSRRRLPSTNVATLPVLPLVTAFSLLEPEWFSTYMDPVTVRLGSSHLAVAGFAGLHARPWDAGRRLLPETHPLPCPPLLTMPWPHRPLESQDVPSPWCPLCPGHASRWPFYGRSLHSSGLSCAVTPMAGPALTTLVPHPGVWLCVPFHGLAAVHLFVSSLVGCDLPDDRLRTPSTQRCLHWA